MSQDWAAVPCSLGGSESPGSSPHTGPKCPLCKGHLLQAGLLLNKRKPAFLLSRAVGQLNTPGGGRLDLPEEHYQRSSIALWATCPGPPPLWHAGPDWSPRWCRQVPSSQWPDSNFGTRRKEFPLHKFSLDTCLPPQVRSRDCLGPGPWRGLSARGVHHGDPLRIPKAPAVPGPFSAPGPLPLRVPWCRYPGTFPRRVPQSPDVPRPQSERVLRTPSPGPTAPAVPGLVTGPVTSPAGSHSSRCPETPRVRRRPPGCDQGHAAGAGSPAAEGTLEDFGGGGGAPVGPGRSLGGPAWSRVVLAGPPPLAARRVPPPSWEPGSGAQAPRVCGTCGSSGAF